jgi:hypothetical protein
VNEISPNTLFLVIAFFQVASYFVGHWMGRRDARRDVEFWREKSAENAERADVATEQLLAAFAELEAYDAEARAIELGIESLASRRI